MIFGTTRNKTLPLQLQRQSLSKYQLNRKLYFDFLNVSSPRESRTIKTSWACNYNEICLQHKKNSDVATNPTIFEHTATEPQKKRFIDFQKKIQFDSGICLPFNKRIELNLKRNQKSNREKLNLSLIKLYNSSCQKNINVIYISVLNTLIDF